MDDMDGSFKSSTKDVHLNGKANGHLVAPRRRTTSRPSRLVSRSFSFVARLLTWYTIATVLFRCPATPELCNESSPQICKPYFQLRQAVAPHLEPYYATYAAPYVDAVRPYYDVVDHAVFVPTRAYVTKHGAPRVAQFQVYTKAQWAKNVQPQLAKYQALAGEHYNQSVAPQIDRVSGAVAPYYDIARTNALQTYHDVVLPSYEFVQPYAARGYEATAAFTTDTAVPAVYWVWNKTYFFLDGTVWPHLRVIYVDTVEPQLARIGQRLGRYKGKELEEQDTAPANVSASPTPKSGASSFTRPSKSIPAVAQSSSSATSSVQVSETVVPPPVTPSASRETKNPASIEAPPAAPSENDVRRIARETVAEDLEQWQNKFAQAADEGALEIEDRVDEIAKRMVRRQARTMGKSLVSQLQDVVNSQLDALKQDIVKIVAAAEGTPESRQEEVVQAVRKVGLVVKEKALDIRNWRENYELELEASITKASESHFKILDSIRDLALQRIGMKWAWMDGITYKDWAKYHALRDRFDEWSDDLKKLIVTHPELEKAQDAAAAVEDAGMEIAQVAAQELARLKQVGIWKVVASDATDDFQSDAMKAAAEAAEAAGASKPVEQAAEVDTSETKSDPLESAATDVEDAVSPAQEEASEESQEPPKENFASSISESIVSIVDKASAAVIGSPSTSVSEDNDEAVPSPKVAATIIVLEPPMAVENATDPGKPEAPEEPAQDYQDIISSSVEEAPAAPETPTVKPAFLGAAAQSVPSRQPILDDDANISASMRLAAGAALSAAQTAYRGAISRASDQQYSAAMSISAQIDGMPKPVHGEMFSSASAAYSAAAASASSRLSEAYDAAAMAVYGTPTAKAMPTLANWGHIEAIAAARLSEGRAWAEEQFESAKVAVGLATPAPTAPVDRFLEQAKYNYYAGLGVAHARYSEFLAAASLALSSITATPTPTPTDLAGYMSSLASVAAASASSEASVVGEIASSAAAAAGDTISEGWEVVVSRVSVQIYGAPTPTPWYESAYSIAGDYAATARSGAAEGISAATEAAGAYAATATDEAARHYEAVSQLISELIHGKEPTFSESVMMRLSAAYSTGVASASSLVSAASATAASVASEATEAVGSAAAAGTDGVKSAADKVSSAAAAATDAVKEAVEHIRDEL